MEIFCDLFLETICNWHVVKWNKPLTYLQKHESLNWLTEVGLVIIMIKLISLNATEFYLKVNRPRSPSIVLCFCSFGI